MSDSEEDVILKDEDGFGEQVDVDDFSFISTEAPTNEKEGNIYDQSENEDEKKQTSQDASLNSKQKKRERSPSPSERNRQTPTKDKNRRIHSSDSDSEVEKQAQHNNNRPPVPMVTPETEVHVDLEEIKSFQGKKALFAENLLNQAPATNYYHYNNSIDTSSFNPAHISSSIGQQQERYKDYTTKKPEQRPDRTTPVRSNTPYNNPMRNNTPTIQQHNQSMVSNFNEPPMPLSGAPPIPGVALTKQQFDEMYANRYKVNTNNNNNTKPRENKQIREPTLQITNPLAPKVPDEIILEEQKRVELKLEVSKIVVQTLNKYFKEGKIANKDDFKHLSRKLTHKIMMKEQGIKHTISEKRTKAIQKFIDNWFRKKGGSYVRKSKPWEKPPSVVNFVPPLHPGM